MIRSPLPLDACIDEVFAGREVFVQIETTPDGPRVTTPFSAIVAQMMEPLHERYLQAAWYLSLTAD